MKDTATIVCCGLIAIAGACIALNNNAAQNTVRAQPAPLNLVNKSDTVTITNTVRDTVVKVKTKRVVTVKRVSDSVRDTIPILYIKSRGDVNPDSLPVKPKYIVRDTVEI